MTKVTKKTKADKNLHKIITSEILKLATSSLGLVAALAWNEFIKELVTLYIKPIVGGAFGIISLLIYAVLVTILAVTITYQLSKLTNKVNH